MANVDFRGSCATICPYTLVPISKLKHPSREHIIHQALGGPKSLYLMADKEANSTYGHTLDAIFLHSDIVKFFSVSHGVKGASLIKEGTANIDGHEERQKIEFSEEGVSFKMYKPVIQDPSTKKVIAVRGWGDEGYKHLENIRKRYEEKGYSVTVEETKTTPAPLVSTVLTFNEFELTLGMAKIAYLILAYAYGDEFILGDGGKAFRKGLNSKGLKEFKESGINSQVGVDVPPRCMQNLPFPDLFSPIPKGHHLLIVLRMSGQYIVFIKLFDEPLTAVFSIRSGEVCSNIDGIWYSCKSDGKDFESISLLDSVCRTLAEWSAKF